MTLVLIVLAFAVGLLVGARHKHRRFLAERSARRALDLRQDAYRLADTRSDLDTVGPVTGEHPKPVAMYQQTDEEVLGPVATSVLSGDGLGPVARLFLPEAPNSTWSAASHLQAPDPQDDTGTGTIAHLSGEWAPAAPAPKQVGS